MRILVTRLAPARRGVAPRAQPAQKLTVGIYAPSVEFGTAQARLAYVQGLAKAIEQNTGIKTEAQSYANARRAQEGQRRLRDHRRPVLRDEPRLEAARHREHRRRHHARVGALTRAAAATCSALKGKKLAYVATGCNDAGFIDNAMLESEVDPSFFGARVGKQRPHRRRSPRSRRTRPRRRCSRRSARRRA